MNQPPTPVVPTPDPAPNLRAEEVVQLLSERLVVKTSKQKVGEVIVRKAVETEIVEVPVRRETLIVEQISPDYRQLARINLSGGEIEGLELQAPTATAAVTVRGEFHSLAAARSLLDAIAFDPQHHCGRVKIEIEVLDPAQREQYQQWFDRVVG